MNEILLTAAVAAAALIVYSAVCLSLIAWRIRREERAARLRAAADPVRIGRAQATQRQRPQDVLPTNSPGPGVRS